MLVYKPKQNSKQHTDWLMSCAFAAIGNPKRDVRKASHRCSKQQ